MTYQSHAFRFGPTSTPKIIKRTILTTLIINFFVLISNALFIRFLHIPDLRHLFSLTTWGIHKFFLWQFFSYLFIQPVLTEETSMSLILHIFFDMYLIWTIGSSIVQARGKKHFIGLYFFGGLFIGLIAYLVLLFFNSPLLFSGAATSIYILLIGWMFLFPEANIMAFLFIPIRAKWLVFGLIGINLFLDFVNGNFLSLFVIGGSLLYGYFYSVLVWDSLSPFYRLHESEKKMIYFKRKWIHYFRRIVRGNVRSSKIYDFKTQKTIIRDDDFMNVCLEKISKKGKRSLTLRERLRMWYISSEKRKKN